MLIKNLSIVFLITAAILAIQPVEAQTITNTGLQTTCAPPYPVTATASIGGGFINWCVYYPYSVMTGATFGVYSILTAPPASTPVFTAAISAFAASLGCTEGTPNNFVPANNGAAGTIVTHITGFTMTSGSESCLGSAVASLTVGVVPQEIYTASIPISILTENVRIDNFNYLCDAPGIAPNAYSTTATTCNDPNLALTGTITCVDCSDTVNIGNTTVNVVVNGTGNATSGNSTVNFTREPSLFILLITIVAVLAHFGELRRDNNYRIAAGFLLLITAFVPYWNDEAALIGLDHMPFKFTPLFTFMCMVVAAYLMVPKDYENEEKQ